MEQNLKEAALVLSEAVTRYTETYGGESSTIDVEFANVKLKRILKKLEGGIVKNLRCVTLTGADDSVSPEELVKLSAEFPFVEWGILIGSNNGTSRFPSREWVTDLLDIQFQHMGAVNLSLHICGDYLRDISRGVPSVSRYVGPNILAFSRCQLNWHGERQPQVTGENILTAFCEMNPWEPEIIFQLDYVNDQLMSAASRRFLCSGLFNMSHGAGLLPGEWRSARTDIPCGWAGGLGPENVKKEIQAIRFKAQIDYWIDMETKLFSGDVFDLEKCRSVLEQVAELYPGLMQRKPANN